MKKALLLVFCVLTAATVAQAGSITLTGTVRDFLFNGTPVGVYNGHNGQGHVDFQNAIADDRGIVQTTLGVDGKPVYGTHPAGTGTTFSQGSYSAAQMFDMWYHDTPGYNATGSYSITLNETSPGSGIYSYSSNAFFPIDGQLFADSSYGHNFSFTYELHTLFDYKAGQQFTFSGDDDVWVFINRQLALDLGGVHGGESATIYLDTLGLTAGNNYKLDVFFAERHTTASNFRIDTTIADLTPVQPPAVPEPATMVLFGSGLTVLGGLLRRKK